MKVYPSGHPIVEHDPVAVNYDSSSCIGWTGRVVTIGERYVRVHLDKNHLGDSASHDMDLLSSMLTPLSEWVRR